MRGTQNVAKRFIADLGITPARAGNTDIAPGLLKDIEDRFKKKIAADPVIKDALAKVKVGTATHVETQRVAASLAAHSSAAMLEVIKPGVLPNDKLYYNIAQRTVLPILNQAHNLTMNTAEAVQLLLNAEAGIGIKPIKSPLNPERVDGLIGALSVSDDIDNTRRLLGAPVQNLIRNGAADFMKTNAEFADRAGLEPMIFRYPTGSKTCKWCLSKATGGLVPLGEAPDGVFQQHDHCDCMIIYTSANGQKSFASRDAEGKPQGFKDIDDKQVDDIYAYDALIGTQTPIGEIAAISTHAIDRAIERNVNVSDISEALQGGYKPTGVIYDKKGRPSQKLIGKYATVIVNPEGKNIITVHPTSSKKGIGTK